MIQIVQHGPVRKFRLARSFGERGLYFTAAYWVDSLLIDTECRNTVPELMQALESVPVGMIVNTRGGSPWGKLSAPSTMPFRLFPHRDTARTMSVYLNRGAGTG